MSFGNISNSQIPNFQNLQAAQLQAGGVQGYNPAPREVNIPTVLPPGGPVGSLGREYELGVNFAQQRKKFAALSEKSNPANKLTTKVSNYFKQLGRALVGQNAETADAIASGEDGLRAKAKKLFSKKSKQVTPDGLPSESPIEKYDPVIGQWPASFNKVNSEINDQELGSKSSGQRVANSKAKGDLQSNDNNAEDNSSLENDDLGLLASNENQDNSASPFGESEDKLSNQVFPGANKLNPVLMQSLQQAAKNNKFLSNASGASLPIAPNNFSAGFPNAATNSSPAESENPFEALMKEMQISNQDSGNLLNSI